MRVGNVEPFTSQVVVQYGTAYVDTFRYGNTPVLREAWTDRIEPYLETYPKVAR